MPPDPPARTVLLVDAQEARRRLLKVRLGHSCGRVLDVATAEEALHERSAHAVDLVVASAHLPGLGAPGLCAELRRDGGPPIIAYGLGPAPGDHVRWLDAGGADCLAGDDPSLLAARCRSALRRLPPRESAPPPGDHDEAATTTAGEVP